MFGGSSKLGRGGGRGGSGAPRNRNSFPPQHRNPGAARRLSLGGGSSAPRQRTTTNVKTSMSAAGTAPGAVEETYSLVPGKSPPAFAMIIRLAPDLVEEIRRLEAQGGTPKIKFDAHSNNTSGNIINVGGKEFKFTWSREFGDLCDIYEERKSGEDGNGLLVEHGCAWRKLNVHRTLDESTTKHVKMRSVEAERKTKSRKAIVLDPGNPSLTKQLALAEANPWKKFNKQKKEPPSKKQKVDPPTVALGGPKPAYKPGLAPAAAPKGRLSASPASSPPDQFITSASPFGTGNIAKNHTSSEDVTSTQAKSKESTFNTEKATSSRTNCAVRESSGLKANFCGKPKDLQSVLINLLKEAPMSLKALEKAAANIIPNAAKKIEPILKKIATFQAPGRYFLKQGVALETSKMPSSESGSSPEINYQPLPDAELNHIQLPVPGKSIVENISVTELTGQTKRNCIPGEPGEFGQQLNTLENVDIEHHSPGLFGKEIVPDNREGRAESSSETGSDSDSESDSSDSGSQSRSPVGGESGSCSDSEASSNSKEGSDVDVDIISDDDREPKHELQHQTDGVTTIPSEPAGRHDDAGFDAIDIEGNGSEAVDIEGHDFDAVDIEGNGSDAVDIEGHSSDEGHCYDTTEKGLPDGGCETEAAINASPATDKDDGKLGIEHFPSDPDEMQERRNFIGRLFDDTETITKDSFNHEQSYGSERSSKGKTKRGPDLEQFNQKSEQTQRLKPESLTQRSESMHNLLPSRLDEDLCKGSTSQMLEPVNTDGEANFGPQRRFNQTSSGKSNSDLQPSGPIISQSAKGKLPNGSDRSNKRADTPEHVRKSAEMDFYANEVLPGQTGKDSGENKKYESFVKATKLRRNQKDSDLDGKHLLASDTRKRKHGETGGNSRDDGNTSGLNLGFSSMDSRTSVEKFAPKGNGAVLQREISDLELGELREPLGDEPVVKQLRRKNSFKHSDNSKPRTAENHVLDLDKRKAPRNIDSSRSPSNTINGTRETLGQNVENSERSHFRGLQPPGQRHLRAEHAEAGSQYGKLGDLSNKSRQNDCAARQEGSIEGYGESQRKASVGAPQQHVSKQKPASHFTKDSQTYTSNAIVNSVDGQKDTSLTCDESDGRKRGQTSLDADDSSYLKYEKEKPELKERISDLSQYKVYVQEYRDKYDIYCSLNKILETYRNEFQKLGERLELAKGRDLDRYDIIMKQLKKSYCECGGRHKRLKKIFIVLHEELKHLKQRIKDYAFSHGKDT